MSYANNVERLSSEKQFNFLINASTGQGIQRKAQVFMKIKTIKTSPHPDT